jgi:K+-transporting ATPase ATPase A chain
MNTELFGIVASFALMLVIGIPLGKYLAKDVHRRKSMDRLY